MTPDTRTGSEAPSGRGSDPARATKEEALTNLTIRPMAPGDWPAVHRIYTDGIGTGNATFEAEPPDWQQFDSGKLSPGRLVAVAEATTDRIDGVVGWTAVAPTSTRHAYRGVVEHSVYVAPAAQGRGIGRALLLAMIESCEAAGIWTIQSAIFPENTASLALHEAAGFRVVGRRERIAQISYGPWAGQWRDTMIIERRSQRVGIH